MTSAHMESRPRAFISTKPVGFYAMYVPRRVYGKPNKDMIGRLWKET